jgi:hypothetical protein
MVHTRLAFFIFVNLAATFGFVWALLRLSEAPVVTAFRGLIPIRDKRIFFSPEQFWSTLGHTRTAFNENRGYSDKGVKFEG